MQEISQIGPTCPPTMPLKKENVFASYTGNKARSTVVKDSITSSATEDITHVSIIRTRCSLSTGYTSAFHHLNHSIIASSQLNEQRNDNKCISSIIFLSVLNYQYAYVLQMTNEYVLYLPFYRWLFA